LKIRYESNAFAVIGLYLVCRLWGQAETCAAISLERGHHSSLISTGRNDETVERITGRLGMESRIIAVG